MNDCPITQHLTAGPQDRILFLCLLVFSLAATPSGSQDLVLAVLAGPAGVLGIQSGQRDNVPNSSPISLALFLCLIKQGPLSPLTNIISSGVLIGS